jgi:PAS domain S-box-containing protein
MSGVILISGDHLFSEELAPLVLQIVVSPPMFPYLADFATHQLAQLDQRVNKEDLYSLLLLENERLELDNKRASEDFSRFRASLLHEIEERRAAEKQLVESEELLRLIMSSTVEAIYGINTEGLCTFANEACLKMLGYGHLGEMLGRNMHDLIHYHTPDGKLRPVEECRIFKTLQEGVGVTVADEIFFRRDGASFPVEYSSYPIRKDGIVVGAVVTWRDITERRRAEDALRETKELFTLFMKYTPVYTFIKQIEGDQSRVIQLSDNFVDMVGRPAEELRGCTMYELFPPDFARKITDDDLAAVNEGKAIQLDEELNGRSYTTIKFPIIRVDKPNLIAGFIIDVTDSKRGEQERQNLEKQLLQAQKLESLGILAGGIAHDFNNILMAIIGNADLALAKTNKESPVADNLRRIGQAAYRAADLAKQMLAYSGKGKIVVEDLDLNKLLEDMSHTLEVVISKKAVLRFNLHQPLPAVEADVSQIRQIIMNLAINASEAIGDNNSGVIAITTGSMECDRDDLKEIWLDGEITAGLYVYLEITDNGCGMDKETMAKLFDPFFTTKFTGRGLGMAAALGIVRGHKGVVKVCSEPGSGTTVKILLPAKRVTLATDLS